jgi:hypothetical protein
VLIALVGVSTDNVGAWLEWHVCIAGVVSKCNRASKCRACRRRSPR